MISARRCRGLWEFTTGNPDRVGSEETIATRGRACSRRLMALCTNLAPVGAREEASSRETDFGELNDPLHFLSTVWFNYWEIPHASFYRDRCVEGKAGRFNIFSSGLCYIDFSSRKVFSLTLLPLSGFAWDKEPGSLSEMEDPGPMPQGKSGGSQAAGRR